MAVLSAWSVDELLLLRNERILLTGSVRFLLPSIGHLTRSYVDDVLLCGKDALQQPLLSNAAAKLDDGTIACT